ncbi:hypothetical protein QUW11_14195 [Mediterranea massiliensis]|nr:MULTISPECIES: hypothetical protein [Mediterranea]MCL1607029.1 hypothetical protein [Mediterranea sp. ET5]MDM8123212.1 hypothetical protein [Mediterranea massiliensis]MDM8199660.1 hypothetical protein [Mediterranea massiliensis]
MAVWNEKHLHVMETLSSNFSLTASTIVALYKEQQKIEIFFRSLKQVKKVASGHHTMTWKHRSG